jgi:RNA polymerase sigma-70 factor (ECF subfamily)
MVPDRTRDSTQASIVAGWFDSHVDAVFAYLARRVGPDLARDLVAEVFRLALERFDDYDTALGTERGWLFGIGTTLVRRHWRTEERRLRALERSARLLVPASDPLAGVDDRVDAAAAAARVVRAVRQLPPDDRDLLVLVAWERRPHAEVAAVLGIPAGTVASRLSRIRARLRAEGGQQDG